MACSRLQQRNKSAKALPAPPESRLGELSTVIGLVPSFFGNIFLDIVIYCSIYFFPTYCDPGLGCLLGDPSKPGVKGGIGTMIMRSGEQWHCTNSACHCRVMVQLNSHFEGGNPRCVCGAPMKKQYAPPNLSYLDFLRFEDPVPARDGSRKE